MTNCIVVGDRIRQARILRSLSSSDVAEHMGWSAATQTRIERAEKQIEESVAVKLADYVRFPLKFLTRAPAPSLTVDSLLFRAPRSTTLSERQRQAEFARFVGEFVGWLDSKHRLPPVRLPRLGPETDPAVAAAKTREALQVGSDIPIAHLTHDVERAGAPVVVHSGKSAADFGEERVIEDRAVGHDDRHFGYSTWVGEYSDRPLIVARAVDSWERTRWTVAHELGHLVLHHGDLTQQAEEQANSFAGELLAPATAVRNLIRPDATLADLIPVKTNWGLSIGALIMHLRRSQVISSTRAETLQKQLYTRVSPQTGRTWGKLEPGWDARDPERPRLLAAWSERCFRTSAPNALAHFGEIWPPDLLGSVLATQRKMSSSAGRESHRAPETPSVDASVVHLADRRARRWADPQLRRADDAEG